MEPIYFPDPKDGSDPFVAGFLLGAIVALSMAILAILFRWLCC
jgi:hypothetical protein